MACLVFLITIFYLVSIEPKVAIVPIENSERNIEKATLGNIRNDPRDVQEPGIEANNVNHVLEDPEGAQVNNKEDSDQVIEPPKNIIVFPGNSSK